MSTAMDADRGLTLARHFLEIGQPARAIEHLDRAAGAAELGPEHWHLRAWALTALDRHDAAREAITTGLASAPGDVDLLLALCDSHARTGDLEGAERAVLAALREEPGNPILLARYARLAAQGGQIEKATRLVEAAAELDPEEAYVTRTRALISHVAGDDRHAAAQARELLEADPEDTFAHRVLGNVMIERGDVRGADRHLSSAARLDADENTVEALREVRLHRHWALLPLWPFQRFGTIASWIGAILITKGLGLAGLETASFVFALAYLALCVYSWVAPPILRRVIGRTLS